MKPLISTDSPLYKRRLVRELNHLLRDKHSISGIDSITGKKVVRCGNFRFIRDGSIWGHSSGGFHAFRVDSFFDETAGESIDANRQP